MCFTESFPTTIIISISFFFSSRRRHTRSLCDWSSDVCSSDLEQAEDLSCDGVVYFETRFAPIFHTRKQLTHQQIVSAVLKGLERGRKDFGISSEIGRASCRERV